LGKGREFYFITRGAEGGGVYVGVGRNGFEKRKLLFSFREKGGAVKFLIANFVSIY